jgi:hypothetical protein
MKYQFVERYCFIKKSIRDGSIAIIRVVAENIAVVNLRHVR